RASPRGARRPRPLPQRRDPRGHPPANRARPVSAVAHLLPPRREPGDCRRARQDRTVHAEAVLRVRGNVGRELRPPRVMPVLSRRRRVTFAAVSVSLTAALTVSILVGADLYLHHRVE